MLRSPMATITGVVRGAGRKIGVVCARFNEEVTSRLLSGALGALAEAGVAKEAITTVHVPGAVEIGIAATALLKHGKADAVVALGAVIRGETGHYDSVCRIVEMGVAATMRETGKPVAFGVLACENEQQALDRSGQGPGNKGAEAALIALEMLSVLEGIAR
jgi:6,7-dimethyl-8-ribityllumazine synthase